MRVETGEFQATMQVALVNDGPVTILLDSRRTLLIRCDCRLVPESWPPSVSASSAHARQARSSVR